MSFYGIGVVTAAKFYNDGYRTLSDIWNSGMLTDTQQNGIIWRKHINLPVERSEITILDGIIGELLMPYDIKHVIAGSYRRGELVSGDIDILIRKTNYDMAAITGLLKDILPVTFASGETSYRGMVRINEDYNAHRIDIRLVEPKYWSYALLYFTGSKALNILMRNRAIEFGLTLSEYELYVGVDDDKVNYPAKSEKDIFDLLQLKYLKPEQRLRDLSSLEESS
jgi:DNA polymerase/3'-5' exonuclease PolX